MFKWAFCPLKVYCGEGELKGDHESGLLFL
jgi:hypothetical protein